MSGPGGRRRDVDWAALADVLGERLLAVDDPLSACRLNPQAAACRAALSDLHNPFAVEEHPGGFHTTGWYGAFEDRTAEYAVAAESSDDVAAALKDSCTSVWRMRCVQMRRASGVPDRPR